MICSSSAPCSQNARENAAQAQSALDVARKRYKDGVAPQLDVLKAQVPAATAEAAVTQAESQVAVSTQTLNSLLGRPLETDAAVADVGTSPPLTLTLDEARAPGGRRLRRRPRGRGEHPRGRGGPGRELA